MTTVDECAQAILNEWRQVEPASAHVLAHMAARIAAARFGDAVVRPTRDQIARIIAEEFVDSPGSMAFPERAADALLAEFWPGTPEGERP